MNAPDLIVSRNDRDQLRVESCIPLGAERREIHVSTRRSYDKAVVCSAHVRQQSEDGHSWTIIMGLAGDGDWSAELERRAVRGTRDNLVAAHRAGLAKLMALLPAIKAQYGIQEAA